jgi:cell division protein FtsB
MIYVFLDVLLERLNKDLDAALLADPQKRVTVTTTQQSRVLRKRNNEKATLVNKKRATVGRKCVKKRARKEKDKVIDGCAVIRHIHRSSKYSENVSVQFTCKDLPVALPVKRKHKVT